MNKLGVPVAGRVFLTRRDRLLHRCNKESPCSDVAPEPVFSRSGEDAARATAPVRPRLQLRRGWHTHPGHASTSGPWRGCRRASPISEPSIDRSRDGRLRPPPHIPVAGVGIEADNPDITENKLDIFDPHGGGGDIPFTGHSDAPYWTEVDPVCATAGAAS
jgi:hypothetical protein